MKRIMPLICFVCFLGSFHTFFGQEHANALDKVPTNYKKRSPVYDYSESKLNNLDTIPDFDTKPNKIKISGTIYHNDGETPAKDVILYIYQADENGNYDMKRDANHKRYVNHRGWIKTNEDGQYTFYTFIPGKYLRNKELKQIHRVIKEPGKPEYELNSFFFNDDPLLPELTLACRAKAVRSMLRLEKKGDMYEASRDIILQSPDVPVQ